jgi:hypothetical protein
MKFAIRRAGCLAVFPGRSRLQIEVQMHAIKPKSLPSKGLADLDVKRVQHMQSIKLAGATQWLSVRAISYPSSSLDLARHHVFKSAALSVLMLKALSDAT